MSNFKYLHKELLRSCRYTKLHHLYLKSKSFSTIKDSPRQCRTSQAYFPGFIIDDTDFHKTGKAMENIGRVFSHLEHKCILGFKCLMMAVTDGKSQLLLDFSIVGEPGNF